MIKTIDGCTCQPQPYVVSTHDVGCPHRKARTVREALAALGWGDLAVSTNGWTLDHTYVGLGVPTPVVTEQAKLFVLCGGEVLFRFPNPEGVFTGRSVYLVRDDQDGQVWDVRRERGEAVGARPATTLRVVESA